MDTKHAKKLSLSIGALASAMFKSAETAKEIFKPLPAQVDYGIEPVSTDRRLTRGRKGTKPHFKIETERKRRKAQNAARMVERRHRK